jgi:hypothetical protein
MPHQVIPIEGNLIRTWRESTQGKNKYLLLRRGRIWDADDMNEGHITLFRESRIDQSLHWCDHFFNYRLKRMHSNGDKRCLTLDKCGEVRKGSWWWDHRVDQRRSCVRRNHRCLRIRRALG